MTNKTNRAIAILLALLLALETVPFFALASETGDGQPDFPAISEEAAPENEQPDKGKDANAGSVLKVYSDPAQVPFEGNAKDEAEETTLIDGDSFITGASLPAGGTLNVQPGDGEALKALLNPAAEPKRGAKQAMKAAAASSQDETFYQLFEVTVSDGESTFATDDALRLTLASGLSLVKEITADGKAQTVKGTVKDVKVYHFNKDYSEYELISAVEWQYNEDQTAVASVSFETNGLSPFGVVYTVDFSYEKKAGNITVHFDTWQENPDDFDFVSYDKEQGIAELDVIALCDSALGETGGKALEAVLSGGATAADFDKAFFSGAAVSVAGKGVEYGKGMILLTDDAAEASVTFTADQAALTVEISGFTLPQKPTVPEQEDGFAYRFLTESATTADILAANQIVSDPCAIVSLSDDTLVSVKEDTLTTETWFDEVMLTLSLSDGTEVEIRLSNPAPVKAGETVIVDGVGSFAADKEVLAGTVLIVEADAKAPEGVVIGGEKKRGGPQESDPVFYNITLVGPDGEPVKDTGADVTIATDIPLPQEEGMVTRVTGVKVYHIDEKGSVDELSDVDFTLAEGRISAIRFATPGFSLFAVTYTVDFYNGEAEYHLTGEESMTLSALFAALGIDRSAADAVNVIFSNPELLAVAQTDDGADWILTSLQPFNTTETLTVDFADGDQIVVKVEDATAGYISAGYVNNGTVVENFDKGHLQVSATPFYQNVQKGSLGNDGSYHNKYRVYAVPAQNYYFLKWDVNTGTEHHDSTLFTTDQIAPGTLDLNALDRGEIFTAIFHEATRGLDVLDAYRSMGFVRVNGATGTPLWYNDNWRNTDGTTNRYDFEAVPNDGYEFVRWDYYTMIIPGDNIGDMSNWRVTDTFTQNPISAGTFNVDRGASWFLKPVFQVKRQNSFSITNNGNGNSSYGTFTSQYLSAGQQLASFSAEGVEGLDGNNNATLYFRYGVTPVAGTGYDFVYWLKDDGTKPQTVNIDNVLTNETTFNEGDTFIGFFVPSGAYLVRLLFPDDSSAGWTWYDGSVAPRSVNGLMYYFSSDSTNENPTRITANANYGYKFVGWYDVAADGTETLISTDSAFDIKDVNRDMVLKPVFALRRTITITYEATAHNANNVNGYTSVSSIDDTNSNVQSFSESVLEGGEAIGAKIGNYGTQRTFQGWIDENSIYIERNTQFIPHGTQLKDGAIYKAVFLPNNGQNYINVDVNDYDLGKVSCGSNSDELLTSYWGINTADRVIANRFTANKLRSGIIAVPNANAVFDHWELDDVPLDSSIFGADLSTSIDFSDHIQDWQIHKLKAIFTERKIITYDFHEIRQVGNNSPDYQAWKSVPWCGDVSLSGRAYDDSEKYTDEATNPNAYTVLAPSSYRRVTRTLNNYNLLTHSFAGYRRSDNGEIVHPGDVITVNGPITLTAVWDAYFPGKAQNIRYNTNTCGFFVRLFDSTFDIGDTGTYTDCLFTSRINLSGSGSFAGNNAANATRFDFYGNSKETDRSIIENIDSNLRTHMHSGLAYSDQYTYLGGNTYYDGAVLTMEQPFPSDDFIFSRIRQWNLTAPDSRKIQISGHQIPQDMLTSDYFDLKWYVLKDQENSWHIDGMLIPKYAKLRATKQFLGVSDAFAAAKNGYKITVTDGQSDTHVLEMHYSDGAVTWTYTMNGTSCTGTQNGTKWTFTDNGNLLAVVDSSDSGNRLSWVLHHLIPMTAYTVTESGYDSAGYAVTASHVIENTPQTSNLSGGASAAVERVYNYPIYLADTSYQTVAFSNLYTLPWVMTIFKQDGNTLHGLDHVTFDLEVRDSQNTIVSSIPSEYTTTSDGQISVVFPSSAGNYTFKLTEREHEGYNAITTITGAVSVTDQGVVTVSNVQGGVTGEDAMVTVDSSNNAVVYIKNMPERVNVKVEKEWAAGASNRPVTMQLLRNNVPLSGKTIVLGAAQADAAADPGHYTTDWNYTWENLPAYIDGSEVVYSAREEWIGEPGGINSIHYNLDNDPSDGYADYIVYQTQSETVNGNLTTISVKIENTPDSGQVVFTKIDTGNKPVAGATFKVYREQDETKPYAAFRSGSDGVVTIQISDLQSFINAYYSGQSVYGTYWMKETSPVGYVNRYNSWYKLEISANNSKLYYTNDNGATYTILYPAEIENEPFTAHVKVVKEGISNAKLAGAKFALYRTATSLVPIRGYANLVTDQNGEIDLGELPQGTYYLSELAAPEGYQLLTGRIAITVTDDRNAEPHVVTAVLNAENLIVSITSNIYSVTVPNTPAGQMMKLRKRDTSSSGSIQNAEFRIYTAYNANDASQCVEYQPNPNHFGSNAMNSIWDSATGKYTTNTDGWIYYGYLPIGRYYVVETAVPMTDAGFAKYEQLSGPVILDVTASQITLTYPNGDQNNYPGRGPANHVDVVIMNTPVGTISVSKTVQVDNADSTELAGQTITFGLFTSQPTAQSTTTVTYTMTLGSSATTSEVAFTGLHMGTYWVYELDGSNHPILDGNTITVNGHVYTVSEATPNVTLTNAGDSGTVSITNGRLTGALKIKKAVTVNGAATLTTLADGEYTFTVAGPDSSTTVATVIIKVVNGVAAQYKLNSDANFTDLPADKFVLIGSLTPGVYTITETEPTNGTAISKINGADSSSYNTTVTVVAGDTTAAQASASFTNNKVVTGQLTVTKYVQLNGTNTAVTESKTFTVGLYKWDATTSNWIPVQHEVSSSQVNWTQTITVAVGSATGTATFSPLTVGETYRVYELNGSAILAEDALYQEYKVTYSDDNGVEVTVTDTNKTTTVTNNKETTAITATKTWGNGTATPPAETSITWTIKATTDNGATDVTSAVLPAGETADHTVSAPLRTTSWQNLPMAYNGKTVTYTVTETAATYGGYTYTADEIASANSSVSETDGIFVFTNPLPTINIPVLKTWADATPAAGDYVKIGLFAADGTTAINQPGTNNPYILTISYDATNNRWPTDPVSFMNLPMYDSTGNAITYTVVETEVVLGDSTLTDPTLIKTVYGNEDGTVTSTDSISTVTFSNTKHFTSYKVRKTWGNGQAAPEGAEIKIKLSATADNAAISEADLLALTGLSSLEVTLNGGTTGENDTSAATWVYEWTGLPAYDNAGNGITYSAAETQYKIGTEIIEISSGAMVPTYTSDENYQRIAENKIPTTSIKAKKNWPTGQTVPTGTTVVLTISAKVSDGNGGTTDPAGVAVSPTSVTLDGTTDETETTVWEYTWSSLPKFDKNGKPITYTVAETGYTIGTDYTATTLPTAVETTEGNTKVYTFTNDLPTTNIVVEKAWSPAGWPSNIQSVTVGLYAKSGTATTFSAYPAANPMTLTITEANSSAVSVAERTFSNLPIYDTAGNPITYSVQEIAVTPTSGSAVAVTSGAVTVNGKTWTVSVASPRDGMFTVTNTYTGMSIQVTKEWTQDGAPKTSASSIGFILHQVLKENGTTVQDRVYTEIAGHSTGAFTVSHTSSGWVPETISGLPIKDTATVDDGNGGTITKSNCDASYYVVETDAAADAGYVLATTYSNDGGTTKTTDQGAAVSTNGAVITIINTETPGVELPATGGPGTALYTAAGITLMLLGALWLLLRRKREQH